MSEQGQEQSRDIRKILIGDLSLKRLIRSLFFIYLSFLLFACFAADRLIFQPHPPSYDQELGVIRIKTADGEQIAAIHLAKPEARYTILSSHGNAEDLGDTLPYLRRLRAAGFAVFSYDYRGYGLSTGSPSVEGTEQDIVAAYDYLRNELAVPAERLILHGRSVGGGPTMALASKRPHAALILESTFVSAFRVAIPVSILPFDRFPNGERLEECSSPVLLIHGRKDRVVPFWHGEKLYELAPGPKRRLWIDRAGHNDLLMRAGARYHEALRDFAASLGD